MRNSASIQFFRPSKTTQPHSSNPHRRSAHLIKPQYSALFIKLPDILKIYAVKINHFTLLLLLIFTSLLSAQERKKLNPRKIQLAMLSNDSTVAQDSVSNWQDIELYTTNHKRLHKQAPELKERSLNGEEFIIGQKGKIQVLNFWYVGCMPCHFEVPHFNKLFKEYQNDTTVEIISLCRDDAKRIQAYYKLQSVKDSVIFEMAGEQHIEYPVIPKAVSESKRYKVKGYPTTFITDTQGMVRFVAAGFTIHSDPDYFYKSLKKAIEEIRLGNAIALAAKNAEED